jgi:hypothetical protein
MNKLIIKAHYGKTKRREQSVTVAVIEINGVRFFSLPPRDAADAERINTAMTKPTIDLAQIVRQRLEHLANDLPLEIAVVLRQEAQDMAAVMKEAS